MTDAISNELSIPSRRRRPTVHMKAAAQSALGSVEENYSVQAAQAEALNDIAEALLTTNVLLRQLLQAVQGAGKDAP